jgi:hypothetical protein
MIQGRHDSVAAANPPVRNSNPRSSLWLNVEPQDASCKDMKHSKHKLKKSIATDIVAGIAWYSRDQWADLRRVVSDPAVLEPTYEDLQDVVGRSVPDFINKGMKLVKVPVDVAELVN